MACGLGLVVSDVPAIKEWVNGSNGIMTERENTGAIADALNRYYNDRGLLTEHAKLNETIARGRADWDKNYSLLKDVYGLLLNKKSSGAL
jgi:glycosyltransferase involved in cell wall biosynthesis